VFDVFTPFISPPSIVLYSRGGIFVIENIIHMEREQDVKVPASFLKIVIRNGNERKKGTAEAESRKSRGKNELE
jgi:hypothetical protein